jgi:hypothetical protein
LRRSMVPWFSQFSSVFTEMPIIQPHAVFCAPACTASCTAESTCTLIP